MEYVKLSSILHEVCKKTTINNQYPVLTSSQKGLIEQNLYFNKQVASLNNVGYKVIERGQYTYRSMSDTGLFYINRLTHLDYGIVSPAYPVFELDSNKILPEYLDLYFKSELFQFQIKDFSNGSTRLALKFNKLTTLKIHIPTIEEQFKIVNEINEITKIKEKYSKEILFLENIVKSQFIEMFGTIDLSEERKEWVEIKEVSKIYTGTTPSTSDDSNWDGDILWITPAEMSLDTFYIYDTVRKITEKGRKSKSLDLMPINTVLLSTRAPIGKVGIVGTPMTCNQGFKNFECGNTLNPIFLYTLLRNNTIYLNSLGSGTTFLEVSKTTISKLRIPLPPLELQNKFADFVQQIDKSKYFGGIYYGIC